MDLRVLVFEEAPGHHGGVAWVENVLLAGRCAVAGVMLPGEAPFDEDADLGAADCADGLGFAGGAGIVLCLRLPGNTRWRCEW